MKSAPTIMALGLHAPRFGTALYIIYIFYYIHDAFDFS